MSYLIFNSDNKYVRIAYDDIEKNLIINTHTNFTTTVIQQSDFYNLKYGVRSIDPSSTPTNWSFETFKDASGKIGFSGADYTNPANSVFTDKNNNIIPYDPTIHPFAFAFNAQELTNLIAREKNYLKNQVIDNIDVTHPYYSKLNDYYLTLNTFDVSSITYPFQMTIWQYLDNKSLPSITSLQYPL
jgi:hypothetical protein